MALVVIALRNDYRDVTNWHLVLPDAHNYLAVPAHPLLSRPVPSPILPSRPIPVPSRPLFSRPVPSPSRPVPSRPLFSRPVPSPSLLLPFPPLPVPSRPVPSLPVPSPPLPAIQLRSISLSERRSTASSSRQSTAPFDPFPTRSCSLPTYVRPRQRRELHAAARLPASLGGST